MDAWRDGEASVLKLVEHELGERLSRLDTTIAQAVIRQAVGRIASDTATKGPSDEGPGSGDGHAEPRVKASTVRCPLGV